MNKKRFLLQIVLLGAVFSFGPVGAMWDDNWEEEEEGFTVIEPGDLPCQEQPVTGNVDAYYSRLQDEWTRVAVKYGYTKLSMQSFSPKSWYDQSGYRFFEWDWEGKKDRHNETLKDVFKWEGTHGNKVEENKVRARLAQNYKIHLMPCDQDIAPILEILLQEMDRDPEFKSLVFLFKVKLKTRDIVQSGEVLPKIVIYPISGQQNAQRLLDKIYVLTKRFRGMAKTPRYNEKITNLLYVTQGDGDMKGSNFGEYYEPDFIYYQPRFEGGSSKDYHLHNPAEWTFVR